MKSSIRLLAGLLVIAWTTACGLPGNNSEGPGLGDRLAILAGLAGSIDPNRGGELRAPTMTLSVPQGALDQETVITYRETNIPGASGSVRPLEVAYTFGPKNLQFNKPATLKICYDPKAIQAAGLEERTVQVQYVHPQTGELTSMGGRVDLANHCVSASIYHFSTYTLSAQVLRDGDTAPTIGGASFFPGRPVEGLPVTVRTAITDWDGGSAVASVRFFYRTAGSAASFQSITMMPEAQEGSGRFYSAKIPGTNVFAAGFEYYIEAYDTLNKGRTRPSDAPTSFLTVVGQLPHATDPIRFHNNVDRMTAGFSRDLTLQVRGAAVTTWYPVPADSLGVAASKGQVMRPNWLSIRYTAEKMGLTALEANYGSLAYSKPVTIYPGTLNRIELLHNDVVITADPYVVTGGMTYALDFRGRDVYDNWMHVLPDLTLSSGLGTMGTGPFYGIFVPTNFFPSNTGTITATIGGFSQTFNIQVNWNPVPACVYDSGTFDSNSCGWGP